MEKNKKVTAIILAGILFFVAGAFLWVRSLKQSSLSGLSEDVSSGIKIENRKEKDQGEDIGMEKIPAATGKVDDIVKSMTDEAEKENLSLSEEDNVATDAVNDTEDINNLSNSYDENQL